jgi:N-acetylglucosaminyldiphosphoundecaprenol N-acetyl-beta-D-mannosaminyltransferase
MSVPNPHISRVDVLGVGISIVDIDATIDEIGRWIDEDEHHYVCVTGVHGVMESQSDPSLCAIHNRSGMTIPDGMPMVWAGKNAGFDTIDRVSGPDLMPLVCERGAIRGWRHFFYGGAEGVPELLAEKLGQQVPRLAVVGTYSPPFRALTADEETEIVDMINESQADIVWVGLSTPKQERWMDAMAGRLDANAVLGVGAAFDFHSGGLKRAPMWMQRSGLEWLYRLMKEPRRLARRYLTNNPKFIWKILRRRPRPMA